MSSLISPSANVSSESKIGTGVRIWDHTKIRENSEIGNNTIIGSHVYIDSNVKIGSNCKIQNKSQLFDSAEIQDGVFIGPGVILTNDRYPRAINGNMLLKTASDWKKVGVKVGKGASIGAGAICVAPMAIGEWALIGAGSVVTRDVTSFALVVGNPAKQIGWVGPEGYKLILVSDDTYECPKSRAKFKLMNGKLEYLGIK